MKGKKRFLLSCAVFLLSSCTTVSVPSDFFLSDNPTKEPSIQQTLMPTEEPTVEIEAYDKQVAESKNDYNYKTPIEDNIKEEYINFLKNVSLFSADFTEKMFDIDSGENEVLSPLSAYMALAMLSYLSDNETKEELEKLMNIDKESIEKYSKYLFERSLIERVENGCLLGRQLLANSIWLNNNLNINEEVLIDLANDLYCDSFVSNFVDTNVISNYIKEKTYGLLNPSINFKSTPSIMLLNTLYLQETWNNNMLDGLLYTDENIAFTNCDGSITQKKFLRSNYMEGQIYVSDSYKTFYINTTNNYMFQFILPNDGYALKDVYNKENIMYIKNIDDYKITDYDNRINYFSRVIFPEFTIQSNYDFSSVLESKYKTENLFSNISFPSLTEDTITISGMVQECVIDVNKKGITGGAFTMIPTFTRPETEYTRVENTLVIDRNFGFVISDPSGTIVFTGIVNNIK